MQKWEYGIITIVNDATREQIRETARRLNQAGEDGWEAFAFARGSYANGDICYLKRPKQQ
jgi:hypothetical protein